MEAEELDQHKMIGNEEEIEDNTEMCNSPRLNQLIKEVIRFRKFKKYFQSIIQGDAENSKKAIQMRAEAEFETYYNVICGTGFFRY